MIKSWFFLYSKSGGIRAEIYFKIKIIVFIITVCLLNELGGEVVSVSKPKTIKGTKITYNGTTYDKILYVSRGYEYSSFTYLDENDNECSMNFNSNSPSFSIETE